MQSGESANRCKSFVSLIALPGAKAAAGVARRVSWGGEGGGWRRTRPRKRRSAEGKRGRRGHTRRGVPRPPPGGSSGNTAPTGCTGGVGKGGSRPRASSHAGPGPAVPYRTIPVPLSPGTPVHVCPLREKQPPLNHRYRINCRWSGVEGAPGQQVPSVQEQRGQHTHHSPARSFVPGWTARERCGAELHVTQCQHWRTSKDGFRGCSESRAPFDPANPGFFPCHRHGRSPSGPRGLLPHARTETVFPRQLWLKMLPFQVTLFIVAAVHFSAFGGLVWLGVFFAFQGSFCQEAISKQDLLSKCTYRLKLREFKKRNKSKCKYVIMHT